MSTNPTDIVILLLVLLFSMSIHEMMHAVAANWLGDDTARSMGRLSLNPLAHIDPFLTVALPLLLLITGSPVLFGAAKPVQVNFHALKYAEFGGAIVGVVGPLTNFVIAAVAALLFNHTDPTFGTTTYKFFQYAIMLNVGLFVFNLIPWPPLDGSRLLYAFAPRPLQEFMESIERAGMVGLVVFVLIFFSFNHSLGTIMNSVIHLLAPNLITQL